MAAARRIRSVLKATVLGRRPLNRDVLSRVLIMTWFEDLTGCTERSAENVREEFVLDGARLRSRLNNKSWLYGELETPTLAQLRERAQNSVRE